MRRRIAFFDFDGTITAKDSLLELIKYHKGIFLFCFGFLLNAPFLIAYKLKVIRNSTAKQIVLRFFFHGTPLSSFQLKCDEFSLEKLPLLIRPKALVEIKKLKELNTEIVIVSASAKNWLQQWADETGVKLICTNLEVKDEKLTGRISGENCHGKEKVKRIKALYDLSCYDEIYCYGDSAGDRPMLSLATVSFYKPFR
ncbi:MAG: haloacid dehalogenase-like hydrolase [Bacteroidetes bacterium]|nr:haloacid dehalogenase-like hydrolase [Bacteroidota bacterium]